MYAAPISVGDALNLLKLVRDWVSEARKNHISKRDRQRIQEEANPLILLASTTEIDKYIANPRQHTIDQVLSLVHKVRLGRSPGKKSAAKRVSKIKTVKKMIVRRRSTAKSKLA